MTDERDRIVAYLRLFAQSYIDATDMSVDSFAALPSLQNSLSDLRSGALTIAVSLNRAADSIERGEHREGNDK